MTQGYIAECVTYVFEYAPTYVKFPIRIDVTVFDVTVALERLHFYNIVFCVRHNLKFVVKSIESIFLVNTKKLRADLIKKLRVLFYLYSY
jgi:hypothetical protein